MPLLRFRSDEQLVALFRAGHDDAFRAIHDRYYKRLLAYARQMLPGRQDAEDALQDVFVRAYSGLRASDHELALRAWLFRVAHNRCIDELRRPAPPPPEFLQLVRPPAHDPLVEFDLRESLRRLVEDIRRLPEQQRSALLMRELGGMSYVDLSTSLGVSVGAVKSLLVRARVALAQAAAARDTSCLLIRDELAEAHDRGLRPNATARKHMRDCVGCKAFRRELRGVSRQLAAISPAVGPLGVLAKLGLSGGAGGGAAGGGGLALFGGGGATATAGGIAIGVNHVAALVVAAVATAGGAVELQRTIIAPAHHQAHAATSARHQRDQASPVPGQPTGIQAIAATVAATVSTAPALAADAPAAVPSKRRLHQKPTAGGAGLSPPTGASAMTNSTTDETSTGSTAAGSATSTVPACPVPATPGSTATATAGTSSGTSVTSAPVNTTTPVPGQPTESTTTSTPCVVISTPSTGSGATAGSSGQAASSASSGTETAAGSSSGSGSASSSGGSAATGGSATVPK